MSTLKIIVTSDESVKYELDGNFMIETDHDIYGWEGMTAVDTALRLFANKFGANVVEDETIEKMPI